jgi:hypothetical protein
MNELPGPQRPSSTATPDTQVAAAHADSVIVSEIKCKSADCSSGAGQQDPRRYRWWEYMGTGGGSVQQPTYTSVGSGMTEMLSTALQQTGCFDVMERASLDKINQELALVGKRVEAEAADISSPAPSPRSASNKAPPAWTAWAASSKARWPWWPASKIRPQARRSRPATNMAASGH